MEEKNKLKLILEFINEFGADQDDMLEKLENELSQLNLLLAVFDGVSKQYEATIDNLENELLSEKLSVKEYMFGKNIADSIGLKNHNMKLDLEIKIKNIEGRIESYKEIISNLKSKFDSNSDRLNKIIKFESQEIDGLKGTNIKLIQRPIGIHPGNPMAARRNKIKDIESNSVELEFEEENLENDNLNNVLNQLNSLLDESGDKLKVVNKELENESNRNNKRGRKSK